MALDAGSKGSEKKNEPLLTPCSLDLFLGMLNPKCLESFMDMCLRLSFGLSSIYSF